MKELRKFVMIPVIIAIQAFIIIVVDQLLSPVMKPSGNLGFSWISFQAWALYFLAGGNIKGGIKVFLSYALGIGASILIMILAEAMTSALAFWAVPLAVGLIAFVVIFFEKVEWLNLIPGLFVGAGAFFAFMNYVPGATFSNAAITQLVYCIIGIIWGFITVSLRVAYEKRQK